MMTEPRGIITVQATDEHWDHGHQCIHPKGVIECDHRYLTGETFDSLWEKEHGDDRTEAS